MAKRSFGKLYPLVPKKGKFEDLPHWVKMISKRFWKNRIQSFDDLTSWEWDAFIEWLDKPRAVKNIPEEIRNNFKEIYKQKRAEAEFLGKEWEERPPDAHKFL